MDTVEVRQCVITTLTRKGRGEMGSPIRVITEVWDAESGRKIAEDDPDLVYHCITDEYVRRSNHEEGG